MTGVSSVDYSDLLLAAFRGDATAAIPLFESTVETATKLGQGRVVAFSHYLAAVLHNSRGDHKAALVSARKVVGWDVYAHQTLAVSEVAEAASREGDQAVLAEVSTWVQARAAITPSPWSLGIASLVCALEAGDAQVADDLFQASIEHLNATSVRTAAARSHLLYGEWLRRRGTKADAREHLEIAHGAFREMGMRAFAERAHRELSAATRRRTRRYVDAPETTFTSQEWQITQLAQRGLSNREIGARLFLSPRTIEWHLRNVFAKVGVSSRRQLRDARLDSFAPATTDDPE
jgi:ATP/maltotriose-dependent transcriptional regulator MalT